MGAAFASQPAYETMPQSSGEAVARPAFEADGRSAPNAEEQPTIHRHSSDLFSTTAHDVSEQMPGFRFFRVFSADVDNDPRMNVDNLLSKRMTAFYAVSLSAALLATVSCTTLLSVQDHRESWSEYFALIGFATVFTMNLASVLVITNQYIAVCRLATAAPTGFDMAISYYSNENITISRHLASGAFFHSIPIFVASIGFMNVDKLGHGGRMSYPLCALLVVAALYCYLTIGKHGRIFREKYQAIKQHESGIKSHMKNLATSKNTSDMVSII